MPRRLGGLLAAVVTAPLLMMSPASAHGTGEATTHEINWPSPVPAVDVAVQRAGDAIVISATTDNFTFSGLPGPADYVEGQGHARLYVDDRIIGRMLEDTFVLRPAFYGIDPGPLTLRVVLVADDLVAYSSAGQTIEAEVTIDVTTSAASAGEDEAPGRTDATALDLMVSRDPYGLVTVTTAAPGLDRAAGETITVLVDGQVWTRHSGGTLLLDARALPAPPAAITAATTTADGRVDQTLTAEAVIGDDPVSVSVSRGPSPLAVGVVIGVTALAMISWVLWAMFGVSRPQRP